MFTGLVSAIGKIVSFPATANGGRLTLQTPADWLQNTAVGDSIAVDGVCLTAVQVDKVNHRFSADISPETIRCCMPWQENGTSNLEHSLRVGDKLGGHFVSGHVDDVAKLSHIEKNADNGQKMVFTHKAELSRYIIVKGSVTLSGVSLTVNEVGEKDFAVQIVAHTLSNTTLSSLLVDDLVNIETDLLGRYVAKLALGVGEGRA
ncbi:MAG: riboflavin synthase [Gammaproteobacteria bacterium WSBS_2016_MAG_OTU1]